MSDEREQRDLGDLDDVPPEGQEEEGQYEYAASGSDQNFDRNENPERPGGSVAEEEIQEQFEDPGKLTSFGKGSGAKPPWFDRRKALLFVFAGFSAVILLALVFNKNKSGGKGSGPSSGYAATVPSRELRRLMELSQEGQYGGPAFSDSEGGEGDSEGDSALQNEFGYPAVLLNDPPRQVSYPASPSPGAYPQPSNQAQAGTERQPQPQLSALVPKIEGSLFASSQPAQAAPQQALDPYAALLGGATNPYAALLGGGLDQAGLPASLAGLSGPSQQDPYAAQNDQAGKQNFYGSASGGGVSGSFLQESTLWIGTVIPAVLETAINTDLPGNVIARVTQNIYDSLTRKNILIPQGTILVAQYNSSVSYAQHRVQVAWDVLIRPDGYQVELEGMNGVDPQGMAGLKAAYHENWFEYLKAAGIVTLFSLINSKMVEEVAKYGSNEMAAGVITSNAEFIKDMGGNFVTKALNIQPTLTVENGAKINVMLNKNIYLPPFRNFQVTQKYTLP
jgi:type IV secretion system protein TrbI